jgi:hypothetical protein
MGNTFCPFLKSECREDCKFRYGANEKHCKLASFSLYEEDFIDLVNMVKQISERKPA